LSGAPAREYAALILSRGKTMRVSRHHSYGALVLFLALGLARTAHTAPVAAEAAPKSNFQIKKAKWGADTRWVDVTEKARALVDKRGVIELNLLRANPIFGDPAPRATKFFRIDYIFEGAHFREEFREEDYVLLPFDPRPPARKLEILEARFGAGDKWRVVTDKIRQKMKNGRLDMNVHGAWAYLGDLLTGKDKVLVVKYSVNGKTLEKTVPESTRACLLQLP
jgi:hypothetical protein